MEMIDKQGNTILTVLGLYLAQIFVTMMNSEQSKFIYGSYRHMLKGLLFSEQVICENDLPHNRWFTLYATLEKASIVHISPREKLLLNDSYALQLLL